MTKESALAFLTAEHRLERWNNVRNRAGLGPFTLDAAATTLSSMKPIQMNEILDYLR
jgi:hypothetical protein